MRMSDAFPSKYIKHEDLGGREVTVRINYVKIEAVGPDKDNLPVMYFIGKEKGMVLNKTNANTIAIAYGDDSDDWSNQPVVLYAAPTEYQGKSTTGLRVRIPRPNETQVSSGRQQRAAPPPPPRQPDPATGKYDDLDDSDIPF